MNLYELLEKVAQTRGYRDLTEFCMKAGISAYIQERFKFNAMLRNDTKAKIAKALKTDIGFVNDLIAKAQSGVEETPETAETEQQAEQAEQTEQIKQQAEQAEQTECEVNEMPESKNDVMKQEKTAANLEFVYKNIDAYRELKDTFYLKQAQAYLNKMVEDAE